MRALVWGRIREVSGGEWQRVLWGGLRMCANVTYLSDKNKYKTNNADRMSLFRHSYW